MKTKPLTTSCDDGLNCAGYLFCCSGVGIYNYLKIRELKPLTAVKGNLRRTETENGRSKDDVMSEMRNLQEELNALDKRLNKD